MDRSVLRRIHTLSRGSNATLLIPQQVPFATLRTCDGSGGNSATTATHNEYAECAEVWLSITPVERITRDADKVLKHERPLGCRSQTVAKTPRVASPAVIRHHLPFVQDGMAFSV